MVFQYLRVPGPSWRYLGSTWPPSRPQEPPRHLQEKPRRLQDAFQDLQDASKSLQAASKSLQDASKSQPEWLPADASCRRLLQTPWPSTKGGLAVVRPRRASSIRQNTLVLQWRVQDSYAEQEPRDQENLRRSPSRNPSRNSSSGF